MPRWVVWVTWSAAVLMVGVTWAPAAAPVVSPPCALAWDPLPPQPDGDPWPDLAYHVYLKRDSDPTYPRVPTLTVDAPATRAECTDLNLRPNRVYRAVVRARATGFAESGPSNEVRFRYREPPPAQPADVVLAINCGGEAYTGADGVRYAADTFSAGGRVTRLTNVIEGTADSPLYADYRYDMAGYHIPLPNGAYAVTLKWADTHSTARGQRVWDVAIEGSLVANNVDIFAEVGRNAAYDMLVNAVVEDGVLDIAFGQETGRPRINAIVVRHASGP